MLQRKLLWAAVLVAVLSTCHADANRERSKRAIENSPQFQGYIYEPPAKPFTLPPA